MKAYRLALWQGMLCGVAIAGGGQVIVFEKSSDDQWQYPFNFTLGTRDTAVLFSSVGNVTFDGFNDRDGVLIAAWDTSDLIPPGMPLDSYDVDLVTVTLTHDGGPSWDVDLTVDEWFQFDANNNGVIDGDEVPDPDCGRPFELFGAGFGPFHSFNSWHETCDGMPIGCTNQYVGGSCNTIPPVCSNDARDPFPFVYQPHTFAKIHVEDSVKGTQNEGLVVPLCDDPDGICPFTPTPWAIGVPEQFLDAPPPVCGSVGSSDPFDLIFQVDLTLSEGAVRDYFQEQLAGGRVFVVVTSLIETSKQAVGNPVVFMHEATEEINGFPPIPGAKAPKLVVTLSCVAEGDSTGEGAVTLADAKDWAECLNGPDRSPAPPGLLTGSECLCAFDFDDDGDVDLKDAASLGNTFGSGG